MPANPSLAVYLYTPGGNKEEISRALTDITLSTQSPGGYQSLQGHFLAQHARTLSTQRNIFAKVAVMDNMVPIWQGWISEPAQVLDTKEEDFELNAVGASMAMQMDTLITTYSAKTALQIMTDQIVTQRSAYINIDQDMTAVFPDNPANSFSIGFNKKNPQDVLNELISYLGDYTWGVWSHPRNKDANGFPTWQLQTHVRALTTSNYVLRRNDIISYRIAPALEYCYNSVTLYYRDSTTLQPASVTKTDPRLNNDLSQGKAPFPYRLLTKDYGSLNMSSTQAQAVATALLNDYQNGGYKITFDCGSISDAQGNPIPLWRVKADTNIFAPDLPLPQLTLPVGITKNQGLYYITGTSYRESTKQQPRLTITCSTFQDTASFQIAALQYRAQLATQNATTGGVLQSSGYPEKGACGLSWGNSGVTGDTFEQTVNFKSVMTNTPSSVTLSATASSNANTPAVTNISLFGFTFQVVPTANGRGYWRGTYQTAGN